MKLTYEPRYNIAYLSLYEKTEPVETIHISDELQIDMAPNGTVYGIELLNANQQLLAEPQNQFVVINEALNNRQAISLLNYRRSEKYFGLNLQGFRNLEGF